MTFQNLLIKRYQGDSVWFILNQADDTFVAFKSFPNVDAAIEWCDSHYPEAAISTLDNSKGGVA